MAVIRTICLAATVDPIGYLTFIVYGTVLIPKNGGVRVGADNYWAGILFGGTS